MAVKTDGVQRRGILDGLLANNAHDRTGCVSLSGFQEVSIGDHAMQQMRPGMMNRLYIPDNNPQAEWIWELLIDTDKHRHVSVSMMMRRRMRLISPQIIRDQNGHWTAD